MDFRAATRTVGRALRRGTTIVVLVSAITAYADAGGADRSPPAVNPPHCTEATIAMVAMPRGATVDGIRVILAAGSPLAGAADVTVHDSQLDRVVHIRGGSRSIQFSPPLLAAAGTLAVTLDPVWETPTPACVERIELLRDGLVAGVVSP